MTTFVHSSYKNRNNDIVDRIPPYHILKEMAFLHATTEELISRTPSCKIFRGNIQNYVEITDSVGINLVRTLVL